jgi:hypothetical protein
MFILVWAQLSANAAKPSDLLFVNCSALGSTAGAIGGALLPISDSGLPCFQPARHMSFSYARKPEGKSWVNHEHTAKLGTKDLADYLIKTVPKFITMATVGPAQSSVLYQEATVYTTPEALVPLCYFLRDHAATQFKCLLDITAVDFPERPARFEVVYHLLSPRHNNRIRVKVRWKPGTGHTRSGLESDTAGHAMPMAKLAFLCCCFC